MICLSTSAPSFPGPPSGFHSALRALTFQLLKGVNIPGSSPQPSNLRRLSGSKGFLTPAWKVGHFFGRRERAVEFPLRRDGYAKCKEEEEEAERRVSQRREWVRGEELWGLANSEPLEQWGSLSHYQGKNSFFCIHLQSRAVIPGPQEWVSGHRDG